MLSRQWVGTLATSALLVCCWPPVIAESQTEPRGGTQTSTTTQTDFQNLSDQRNRRDLELREAQRAIDRLTYELADIKAANESLAYYKDVHTKEAQNEVKLWSQRLNSLRSEQAVRAELEAATTGLAEKQAQLASVESKIKAALDIERPKQEFKTELSIAFSILLLSVIAGFYWIVGRHHSVRSTIFAGDAGLQFITLFALIIAIILFGLTEILQGRELSALLGGISGYILGRSAGTKDASANATSGRAGKKDGPAADEGEDGDEGEEKVEDAESVADHQQP
jgi:hypothetical protein